MVEIFVLKKLSALETIYFQQPTLHGKNNGFTTNDWQEKTHFRWFSRFCSARVVQSVFTRSKFCPRRLEDCSVANKVWKMTDLSKGWSALADKFEIVFEPYIVYPSALETINSGKTHQYSVDILCKWLSPPASSANWKLTGAIRALNSALNDWNI